MSELKPHYFQRKPRELIGFHVDDFVPHDLSKCDICGAYEQTEACIRFIATASNKTNPPSEVSE